MYSGIPVVKHDALPAFATLAERFCDLVERRAELSRESLQHGFHQLTPALYSAALNLPPVEILYPDDELAEIEADYDPAPDDPDSVSAESWRALHAEFASKFGHRTYYREIFDPYPVDGDEPEVVGSIADDVSDIYRDLKSGLAKWRRGESGAALWMWRFNFEVHWGDHAASLLRALHVLAEMHDDGWPSNNESAV